MLERPNLADNQIIACLRDDYGLPVAEIAFLPIGNDSSAWAYGVRTDDGQSYFLKVRRGSAYEPALTVPKYLRDSGIQQVVAPLPTATGGLSSSLGNFVLILYPFIEGCPGGETGMSDSQWVEFGATLNRIHSTSLPSELVQQMRTETFAPKWSGVVRELQARIENGRYSAPAAKELAAFWRPRSAQIQQIVERAEELGRRLQSDPPPNVLCHADIHTWNILIDRGNRMFFVDWDEIVLAPRERDLMFVVEDTDVSGNRARAARLFFQGYGATSVDTLAIAYYRYEWVVQEFGDYGERVFLVLDAGDKTRQDAVSEFRLLFEPGDVVDLAYRSDI